MSKLTNPSWIESPKSSLREAYGPFSGTQVRNGLDGSPELYVEMYGDAQVVDGLDDSPADAYSVFHC